jgi:hypothetical protein
MSYARELLAQHQVSRMICVNGDRRIEGVISLSDITDLDASSGARAEGNQPARGSWRLRSGLLQPRRVEGVRRRNSCA